MNDSNPRSFGSDFKTFFIRGLVVLLPTILTLWIVVKAYEFVDNAIAEPINRGIRYVLYEATPHWKVLGDAFEPTEEEVGREFMRRKAEPFRKEPTKPAVIGDLRKQNIQDWWDDWWLGAMDLIGLFVAIIAVYFAGRLLGGFFGRSIYRRVERAIITLPVFKQVYPSVKQVVDFLFGQDKNEMQFKRVVLVQYPRKGIWSVGLLTGSAMKSVNETAGESVTVFIPSSPTPFTGYTISIPRTEIREIPISIDEALRFTVSGGVLMPDHETLPPGVNASQIQQPPTPVGVTNSESQRQLPAGNDDSSDNSHTQED